MVSAYATGGACALLVVHRLVSLADLAWSVRCLGMKSTLALVLSCLAGIILGALFSPLRYTTIPVGAAFAYRLDRLTGEVELFTPFGHRRVRDLAERTDDKGSAATADSPFSGYSDDEFRRAMGTKPLKDYSDQELAELLRRTPKR